MRNLALAAVLLLAASGCAAPSAETSSAGGTVAGAPSAAEGEKANPGSKSGVKGKDLSWWQRITRAHKEPKETPWVYGDVRPGKGLLSDDADGFVLYRQGEGRSPDPGKPAKVRR